MMRRFISFILAVVFIFQTAFPALATIASLEDLEKREKLFKTVAVLQTSRHFASEPDKTAAGILPVAIHEGKEMVLVALRDDGLGWCNFGGASDAKEEEIHFTASRETLEESMGVYALHPRIFKKYFSHAIYNPAAALEARNTPTFLAEKKIPKILLYRMYITPVEYVSASVFKEKLELATEAHHKEYTDFVWIPLEDLIEVIHGNTTFSTVLSKIRKDTTEASLTAPSPEGEGTASPQNILFEPFFEMLKASPVQDHLKDLLKREDPSSRSSFARESHTVSLAGNTAELPQSTYVKWEPVSLEENPNALNFLAQQKPRVRTVFLGKSPSAQNLFATGTGDNPKNEFILGTKTLDAPQQKYFYSERQPLSPETVLYQETVPFDPKQELKYFNAAFPAKVAMNLEFKKEMKKRAKEKYEATHRERTAPSIPSPQDTATEAHLRLWLGETYLPGDHKANINALIEKFGKKRELGRDVDLTIEALTRLSTVLEVEKNITSDPRLQKMPFGYEAYYHGCREEMILLNQVSSAMENLFSMRDDGEFSTLRGTFSYMDKYKEMTKALETYHQDHRAFYISLYNRYKSENRDPDLIESSAEYRIWAEHQKDKIHKIWKETLPIEGSKKDNNQLMLWVNAALTAGHISTSVSSSTIEYFLNAHSVKEPLDARIFRESMALRGIEAFYDWFQSLSEQYVKPLAPTGESNGGLLQVFVTTALTDIYMNTVEPGGGRLYGHPVHIPEADRKPYVSRMLEKLREEATKRTLSPEEQAAREVMETIIRKLENSPPLDEKNLMKSLISEVCLMLHPLLTQAAFVKQTPEADPDTVEATRSYDAHYQNPYFPPLYTKGYLRYPLSDAKKKAFDFKLSQTASALMADWLSQGTKPLEGSFYKSPAFFDFYKKIYQDFTGETPPQETYKNSLPYLINMGDVETVKSFLNLHADALTTLEIDFKKCFMQLLCDEHWDMFLYLFESLKEHQDFTDFFTPFNQKLIAGIIADSKSFSEEAETFFKSHLDVTTFDESFKESLLSRALNPDDNHFFGHEPLPTFRGIKFFIDIGFRISTSSAQKDIPVQKRVEKFRSLYNPYVPAEEKDERGFTLFEQLLDFTDPFQEGQSSVDLSGVIISLLQRGANWKSETRTPGIPILFELLRYIYPSQIQTVIEALGKVIISEKTLETEDSPEEILGLLFSGMLESEGPKEISPPSLQDILSALEKYKTSEGLSFFQYLQRAYLEGSSVQCLSGLRTLLLSQKDEYKHLSYPPFLRFFPENEYLSDTNPWASKEARYWQKELDEALETEDEAKISELIENCTDTDLLRINSKFFSSLSDTYDALREAYSSKMFEADKRWSQEKEPYKRQWHENFKKALENPAESAEEELKHLINTLATRNDYYPDMFEELSTLKTRFPDLHTLYEEKDQLFVDFIFEKKKETHLLATEHEALACALQTQKKEDIKTTFQAFKEKVEEILSTPDATVRTPGFYYKSLWFIPLESHHAATLREREIGQRRDVLTKNKNDLDAQKKEWRDTVQKAVDGEDMETLTNLISADPHGIFSAPDTPSHQYISSSLLSQLATNKFKTLLPLLIKKVKNWKRFLETASANNQHEFLMSFCENYPDLLSFLKKEGSISCFHGIHENLPTLLSKNFPQFLKDPIEAIGEDNFCTLFYTSLENKEMTFLTSLPPSVFKQTLLNSPGPYFWSFAFYPHTHQFVQDLVKKDPSFLALRGYLEMSLQEYVDLSKSVENESSQIKPLEIFLKKITP